MLFAFLERLVAVGSCHNAGQFAHFFGQYGHIGQFAEIADTIGLDPLVNLFLCFFQPEPEPAPEPEPEPEPEVVEEPVQEEIPEEVVAAPAEEPAEEPTEEAEGEEEDEGAVSFVASKSETLEEKYLALSADEKRYYDEILFHAAGKENARRFRNVRYEDVKIGQTRLVRMRIKRGVITCEFTLYNTNFKNYINENKLSVKQAPTVLKITDEAAVRAAIDSIDIVVNNIAEEKEYKKQLAREKRKAARLAAQEAEKAE